MVAPATFVRMLRPNQWIKNFFVFSGVLFGQGWKEPAYIIAASITMMAFCLVSSSIYVFNDVVDREADRLHPKKCRRPIANGEVTIPEALVSSVLLSFSGLIIGRYISFEVMAILGLYILINIAYSLVLKHKVLVDVFCISAGFMLRIFAGTVGLGIPTSQWLLICGMMVTLFLAFAKRRAEALKLEGQHAKHREVLGKYNTNFLDQMISITATGTVLSYSLYAMSDYVLMVHGAKNLMATVPFVAYGIFRYVYLVHHYQIGGHPSTELVRDRHIIGSTICWLIITLWHVW